ncbi:MAG: iron ABC transporter permease [Spirochaetales bacterium]|nr:iron ABC transporter permease [Spirochaetales bacterium]
MKDSRRNLVLFIFLVSFCFSLFILRIFLGSVWLSPRGIFDFFSNNGSPAAFIFKVRIGRAIMALFAGAGLSVAGLLLQVYFRNPLAGPFVLGINSGASLGAALAIMVFSGIGGSFSGGIFLYHSGVLLFSCLGAFLMVVIVSIVSARVTSNTGLLIFGVLVGYFINAAISIFSYFSVPEKIKIYFLWAEGSFNPPNQGWMMNLFVAFVLFFIFFALFISKNLNIMKLGDNYAQSSGVNLVLAKVSIIIPAGFLSGIVTSFCGPIAFVGLFVPHVARMAFHTEDHRVLVPGVVVLGGIMALLADLVAQLPGLSYVLPVNPILTLVSAPFVLFLILKNGRTNG